MTTITLKGTKIHTVGELPPMGAKAPDFTITKTDLSESKLHDYAGKKVVLNIFPSLDTPTCASAMMHFDQVAAEHPDTSILCISADLPFAQKRFCTMEHLENVQTASIFRHPGFGEAYGVTIVDGPLSGLLSRAVVILDEQGHIIYTQQVKELADEPDYAAIANALKK